MTLLSRPSLPLPRRLLRPAALLLVGLLAGCEATPQAEGSIGFLSNMDGTSGTALEAARVADNRVVIRGPDGYCIDARSLRNRPEKSFALLARCDVLSGGLVGAPVEMAVLTVTVTPASGSLPRAETLASSFSAGDVLKALNRAGLRLLQLARGGNDLISTADPQHWRGAFELKGYLVSMAAYGPPESDVRGNGGRSLLQAMARAIQIATRDGS
ncbi:hypothetical protein KM176_09590 [Pseudooceanicola sp. CBS1P-1]|uniref:Uncharacterized protein n=1 Tax=Pseudooceanicola albus TaxID=2692189 RepID=A0A6L7G8Z3_9RHOB|nr:MULTISPECIES: hypothetical protein [Pseudooceanicola]MBT9384110.1 hypothetical protein [Pseudooceanicola endophyticus]MXN19790.1 hypothetical protein [Pseudooceanicola albus]